MTFERPFMWWCTVRDGITINPNGQTKDEGHIWLTCDRGWNNQSIKGKPLAMANLPGLVTSVAGFQATICEPQGWREALRIIRGEEDHDAAAANDARKAYELAVAKMIARLSPQDFELLIDLILSRYGWVRLAELGGTTKDTDIEAENAVVGEIAFVQIKSTADQAVLGDYVQRFNAQRDRYQRMIFAVHTPKGTLTPPANQPVQVWAGDRISHLVVRVGLGEWVSNRL